MSEERKARLRVLAFSPEDRTAATNRVGRSNWTDMTWEERLQSLEEQAGTRDAEDPQNASTPSTPNNAAASENFDEKLQRLEQSLVSRLSKLEDLEKASKPEANQPFRIAHDDRYRTLAEHALDPKVGSTETVGACLMNQIKLPECVNTSVWLTPLIDSRMWYGEPKKPFVDLPLHLQENYATEKLQKGSTTN